MLDLSRPLHSIKDYPGFFEWCIKSSGGKIKNHVNEHYVAKPCLKWFFHLIKWPEANFFLQIALKSPRVNTDWKAQRL